MDPRVEAPIQAGAARSAGDALFPLFSEAPIAMAVTRLSDGAYVDVNEQWCQTIGYARGELLGRTVIELGLYVDPTDRERVLREFRATGRMRDQDVTLRRKDGRLVHLLTNADAVVVEGEPCILSYLHDITARREAELALELNFQQTTVGMVVSANGAWIDVNPAFCALLGYSRDELLALGWAALTHPDDLAAMREKAAHLAQNAPEVLDVQKRYVHKDGHTVWADVHTNAVRSVDGTLLRYVSYVIDTTARRDAERATRDNAVARTLVRRILREFAAQGAGSAHARRELGRAIGADLAPKSFDHLLDAHAGLGIGTLRVVHAEGDRLELAGDGLLECTPGARTSTCYLTLGILEGATGALLGASVLGAETQCQSHGHAECRFALRARPAE